MSKKNKNFIYGETAGEPVSKWQQKENNKKRPAPTIGLEFTPGGPVQRAVYSKDAYKKNHRIDNANAFMQKRLDRKKNRAKGKFNAKAKDDYGLG